jgi:hypothetical protein
MAKTDFEEFIQRQRKEAEAEAAVDWKAHLRQWLGQLDALYAQVEAFLRQYIESGEVTKRYKNVELTEENFGQYKARSLILGIGSKEVSFVPIGALVIGAYGRVDLIGPRGEIKIVLVGRDITSLKSKVKIVSDATTASKPTPNITAPDLGWKIVTYIERPEDRRYRNTAPRPRPQMIYIDLTEESLMQAIMEVANA